MIEWENEVVALKMRTFCCKIERIRKRRKTEKRTHPNPHRPYLLPLWSYIYLNILLPYPLLLF